MPRLVDRRTGQPLGTFSVEESAQLSALLAAPSTSEEPYVVDPEIVERFAERGGISDRLLAVLQQVLQGREDFAFDWETDAD